MEIDTRNEEERRWVKEYATEEGGDITGNGEETGQVRGMGGKEGIVEVAENLKLETRITLCAEEILKM